MTKKIIISALLTLLGFAVLTGINIAFAQNNSTELFQPVISNTVTASKAGLIQNLPKGDWQDIVASVIKLVLGVTGSLAFISFTYGGILMITAQGDDTKNKKGRSVIFWSLFALVIIAVSYSIVVGITNLKFFN
jgi:choline-glycine betaine transporter